MPHVDLVIAYLGIPSADVGSMTGRAKLLGKDIIYLFERKLAREVVDGFKRNVAYIFSSTEGLKSIKILGKEEEHSLDVVYSFSSPESILKHIENLRKAEIHFPFAVIKFDREEEALELLEKEIDDFFKRYRK
jgi:dihydrodipicolinate reductase